LRLCLQRFRRDGILHAQEVEERDLKIEKENNQAENPLGPLFR
jgi:hypothetical protein